ncbi:MAG: hypothetical protein ACJ72D_28845 [Marmoricola sp.]
MTTGVVLPDAPHAIVGRRLFAVQDIEFTVADVARHARRGSRELFPLAASTRDPAAVQESFRRARGLLTSDRLESWLADWEISADAFVAWSAQPDAESWVGYVCSGLLDHDSAEVAAAAAAACALGAPPDTASTFDPTGWVARLTQREVTAAAVQAAFTRNRLGWTTVRGAGVFARSRAVAEELRHCVLVDGQDLSTTATRAGCPRFVVDGKLEDLGPPQLRAKVSGSLPGEVVGPVAAGPGWAVLHLDERIEPAADDAACLARARTVVATDVVQRAVLRHVST